MSRGGAAIALALASLALVPTTTSAIASYGPQLTNLRVAGGEASWHALNEFRVDWDRTAAQRLAWPLTARNYLVRGQSGAVVGGPIHVPGSNDAIDHIHVPERPGTYRLEVWLQSGGTVGPRYSALLRFDDAAPERPDARPAREWFAAGQRVTLAIEASQPPRPASGVRGYAVSADRGRGSLPCAAEWICDGAEIQPGTGLAGDTVSLGVLAEGLSFARLAAVSGAGLPSATVTVPVRVDASVPAASLAAPPGWSSGPVTVVATASDPLSGMRAAGPTGPFTAIAIDGGVPTLAAGGRVEATVRGEGVHTLAYYARDAAGNVADGQAASPTPRRATVRIDETPPELIFARAQDAARPERIEATLADALSGPHPREGSIGIRPAGSRQPFQPLPTSVAGDRLVAHWSSEDYPNGRYEFTATGYDAAGNASRTERRAKGGRMILVNPLKESTELRFGFGGRRMVWRECSKRRQRRCRRRVVVPFERRPATRSVAYGRRPLIGGRLLGASGRSLAGRPVEIVETFAPGAAVLHRTSSTATDGSGAFRVRLAAGPTRTVQARFPGSATLSRAASRPLQLGVLTLVRLRASARTARIGGRPVLFAGRVFGAGASLLAGRPVELQFRVGRLPWSEFRTVETDTRGRFRYPYSFTDDDSRNVRFQFRAVVKANPSWPYEPAASRPVLVTGR